MFLGNVHESVAYGVFECLKQCFYAKGAEAEFEMCSIMRAEGNKKS